MSLQSRIIRTAREHSRGFTLMEMLIVIAIMLLLVIATLPRIKQTLEDSKLRESSRQLNSYLAMAKSRAAATGRPCGLWLVPDLVNGTTTPALFQSTQLYLAEVPPSYSGDFLESRVIVHGNSIPSYPTYMNTPWLLQFSPPGSEGSLYNLIADGDIFRIRFDHKGPVYIGTRSGNQFQINGGVTLPPHANGDLTNNVNAGYQYEIIRNPQRIGAPLSLPRGTCVDLTCSGFGNTGINFFAENNPQPSIPLTAAMPAVLLMFTPEGRVDSVSYHTWDLTNSVDRFVSNDAQGTVHFLIGRPEKILNSGISVPPPPNSNLADNDALWVSVGRLTGSVTTTENAFTTDPSMLPASPTFFDYVIRAREFAITQDVKGGQ
jgi:prepilin-type N-terminal cleavage/methylation domain-containing protein